MIRKTLLIISILFVLFDLSFASKVEKSAAEKVAKNFYFERINQLQPTSFDEITFSDIKVIESNGEAVFYIFNLASRGFVLVAAEDAVVPVLGYSYQGEFKYSDENPALYDWITGYEKQIEYVVNNEIKATPEIISAWERLQTDDPYELLSGAEDSKNVDPLLKSKWNQGTYFNKFCPIDPAASNGRCPTGCTSTAMGQVMYYYRYPETGFGTKTYGSNYGYLSADFGNTTYDFNKMVNEPASNTGESGVAISRLIYHAGVGVSMDYKPDGSSAGLDAAAAALKIFFLYSSSTTKIDRAGLNSSQWKNYLTANLESKKPVIYAGYPSSGNGSGHAFVCDGFQGTDYFHFNWGWSGSSDGYYNIDNLNPGGLDYSGGNVAVINIYPKNNYPYTCSNQVVKSTSGTIHDGSGPMDYEVNANCSWLITSPDEDSVIYYKLSFDYFRTEATNDVVTIYDGETTSAPIIGTFSGYSVPTGTYTSTGNKVLVSFTSDGTNTDEGWQIKYTSTTTDYCNVQVLTDGSGTISDGSGDKNYVNNTSCLYFIRPTGAKSVTLHFTKFETEEVNDFIVVTDANNGALLGKFSGTNLPPSLTSNTGAIQLFFKSDYGLNADGWEAYYDTTSTFGIEDINILEQVDLYPNPVKDNLNISLSLLNEESFTINIVSITGQLIYQEEINSVSGDFMKSIDMSGYNKGVYFLQMLNDKGIITKKIILE